MMSTYLNDWVVESPVVTSPSRLLVTPPSRLLTAQAGCRIASHHPLFAPPSRRLITPAGCCVASCRATLLFSSHCAALSSSRHHLTAPHSCPLVVLSLPCLIVPAGCCVASRRAPSHRSLAEPPSHHLAMAGCCVASCCTVLSSSRCAALRSSRCTLAGCWVASIKRCRRHRTPPPPPPLLP